MRRNFKQNIITDLLASICFFFIRVFLSILVSNDRCGISRRYIFCTAVVGVLRTLWHVVLMVRGWGGTGT